ncbi:MAG: helix-turn-helix transcriptional regulator [Verrucomicrobia bacterium]|nr:helix-turn-helix transcriptional regulator [Verrucomicrobiota bacterium]
MKRTTRSHCPIAFALDIFGDKWSLLLLRDLLFKDKRHYSELLAAEEGISTNILSERLARLEAEGLIAKSRDQSNRRQFIYSPTQKGLDLLPALLEISLWSAKYDPKTTAPPAVMRRIRTDRDGFIRELAARFTNPNPKS